MHRLQGEGSIGTLGKYFTIHISAALGTITVVLTLSSSEWCWTCHEHGRRADHPRWPLCELP